MHNNIACINFRVRLIIWYYFIIGDYGRYGIIHPYKQVMEYSATGHLTCHSAIAPRWSYNTYKNNKATYTSIPYNSNADNILLINGSEAYSTQFICQGAYPDGSYFQADAFVFRASKTIVTTMRT